jgi:hypothetical protein
LAAEKRLAAIEPNPEMMHMLFAPAADEFDSPDDRAGKRKRI